MAIKQARRSRRCAPKDEIAAKGAKWADLAFGKFILVAQLVLAKPKGSCGNRCIAIQGGRRRSQPRPTFGAHARAFARQDN
jgi:hypothetical protein